MSTAQTLSSVSRRRILGDYAKLVKDPSQVDFTVLVMLARKWKVTKQEVYKIVQGHR